MIDHLDVLKRETVGARNAIRWLEAEFKKGNRYVPICTRDQGNCVVMLTGNKIMTIDKDNMKHPAHNILHITWLYDKQSCNRGKYWCALILFCFT